MTAERTLSRLLAGLAPVLDPETYVFVTLADRSPPETISPLMLFQEAEGLTLIIPLHAARAHGLDYSFACRRITLEIHSALEAVGLIAYISDSLAKAGIATNPVSAFFHDHLFVPETHARRALEILEEISSRYKSASQAE